jgi:hypothetical protein
MIGLVQPRHPPFLRANCLYRIPKTVVFCDTFLTSTHRSASRLDVSHN